MFGLIFNSVGCVFSNDFCAVPGIPSLLSLPSILAPSYQDAEFWCDNFYKNCSVTDTKPDSNVTTRDEALEHVTLAFASSASVYRKVSGVKHGHIVMNPSSSRPCTTYDTDTWSGHRKHKDFAYPNCPSASPDASWESFVKANIPGIPGHILSVGGFVENQVKPFGGFDEYFDSYPCRSVNIPTGHTTNATGDWVEKSFHNEDAFMRRYKSESLNLTVIAFRGSDSLTDYEKYNFETSETGRGYARGFGKYFGKLRSEFDTWIQEANNDGSDIVITGHSLGGAASYIAASHLHERKILQDTKKLKAVITFGAPKVGSEVFNNNYMSFSNLCDKTFSFANDGDIVPMIPPKYRHPCASQTIQLNSDDQVQNTGRFARHDMFTGYQRGLDRLIRSVKAHFVSGIDKILSGGNNTKCEWRNNRWWSCKSHDDCNSNADGPNFCFKGECRWLLKNDKCGTHSPEYKCAPGLKCTVHAQGQRPICHDPLD